MKPSIVAFTAAAVVLASLAAPAAHAAPGVEIKNAVARVEVIPEARSNVSVTVHREDARLPMPSARVEGDRIIVDGGLWGRIGGCGDFGLHAIFSGHDRSRDAGLDTRSVRVRGVGVVPYDHLPLITVRTPMRSQVGASGAVWGKVAPSQALDLSINGCGDWTAADVSGPLSVSSTGSGDLTGERAGALDAHLSGSGDLNLGDIGAGGAAVQVAGSSAVKAGAVSGPVRINITGSGDVDLARVQGPIQAQLAASGAATIAAGQASHVAVDVVGSGDFNFHGTAGALSATVAGSGDVTVDHVSGPVSKTVVGSGEVRVGS